VRRKTELPELFSISSGVVSRRESFSRFRRAQLSVYERRVSILNRRKVFRVQLSSLKSFTINARPSNGLAPRLLAPRMGSPGKMTRESGDFMHTLLQDLRYAVRQL